MYPSVAAYNNGSGTPSETITYKHDAFGRVVETDDTVGNNPAVVTTWSYDAQGNVLSKTSPEGTVSYAYDNLGRKKR